MQSASFSVSSRIWLDQLRQATPGPFARFRAELSGVLDADLVPLECVAANSNDDERVLRGLLRAFEAGYRDEPLAAEDALRELIDRPPPDSLLAALFSACTAVRMAAGQRRCNHTHSRTLALIH